MIKNAHNFTNIYVTNPYFEVKKKKKKKKMKMT